MKSYEDSNKQEQNILSAEGLNESFQTYFDEAGFPKRLFVALRYSGKQRKDIYELTNINEATLSNYTNGNQRPNRAAVERLAQACGVTFSWLAGAKDANIEYNIYRRMGESRFSEGFENRIDKIAYILCQHLHYETSEIKPFIELIKNLSDLNPNGIASLSEYAQNIKFNPDYKQPHRALKRYKVENSFDRDLKYQLNYYSELYKLNDLLRNIEKPMVIDIPNRMKRNRLFSEIVDDEK